MLLHPTANLADQEQNHRILTLFRLGEGGGGFSTPPLRQNRDNSYTERAMTFKFSDFS